MKIDAETNLENYRKGIEQLTDHLPNAINEYNHFTGEVFQDGEIDRSHKLLMALSIGVKDGDEASMTYHLDPCVALDCSDQQIYEAMLVAAAYGGGSAMSQGVTAVLKSLNNSATVHESKNGETEMILPRHLLFIRYC